MVTITKNTKAVVGSFSIYCICTQHLLLRLTIRRTLLTTLTKLQFINLILSNDKCISFKIESDFYSSENSLVLGYMKLNRYSYLNMHGLYCYYQVVIIRLYNAFYINLKFFDVNEDGVIKTTLLNTCIYSFKNQ